MHQFSPEEEKSKFFRGRGKEKGDVLPAKRGKTAKVSGKNRISVPPFPRRREGGNSIWKNKGKKKGKE